MTTVAFEPALGVDANGRTAWLVRDLRPFSAALPGHTNLVANGRSADGAADVGCWPMGMSTRAGVAWHLLARRALGPPFANDERG